MGLFLQALTLCGNHMSLYQLTVEQGTPLAKALKNGEMVCQIFGRTVSLQERCFGAPV